MERMEKINVLNIIKVMNNLHKNHFTFEAIELFFYANHSFSKNRTNRVMVHISIIYNSFQNYKTTHLIYVQFCISAFLNETTNQYISFPHRDTVKINQKHGG